ANSKVSERVFRESSTVENILDGIIEGNIEHLFVYGMNLIREYPGRERVREALNRLETLAVADYLENDLTDTADVVLPLTTQFEEPGVMVNVEGRIRARPEVTPPEERILPGWKMLSFFKRRDGYSSRQTIVSDYAEDDDVFPDVELEDVRSSSEWLESFEQDSGEEVSVELTDTSGEWTVFSEPYLWSGDRRAQLGESLEVLIRDPVIECNRSDSGTLGADQDTSLNLSVNGTSLTRSVEITNNPPEGSLFVPWRLRDDESLELYAGNNTYRRLQDVSSGEVEEAK
ncbi:MAG: molybdopterin-dependent oxidoreductase, partial [bacterium]